MFRCDLPSARRTVLSLIGLVLAALAATASAQVPQRNFPPHALRGEIAFGQPPEITVNGVPARLAPGARVRGQNNMLQMSAALAGGKAVVNYTIDNGGQVFLVWILNDAEIANKPWPATPQQAQQWRFDPIAQVWSKP
jgi:hypothetical protein